MNLPSKHSEDFAHSLEILGGLHHNPTSVPLFDLNIPLEDGRISKDKLKGSDGHRLRDSSKVEDTLLFKTRQIKEAFVRMSESVEDHL